jgi:hypothetical protein
MTNRTKDVYIETDEILTEDAVFISNLHIHHEKVLEPLSVSTSIFTGSPQKGPTRGLL